jgi:voltage-gated potassium channel
MRPTETNEQAQGCGGSAINQLFILALTLFSLLMVAAYFLLPLTDATKQALLWLDVPICLIFLADAFVCLRRAPSKGGYLKWGWLDFLGSIPLLLPLRVARLRRLVEIWRTLRLRRLRQVGDDLDQNRAKAAALIMVLLVIVVLTTATVAALEFESEVPESNLNSAGDAFWWSIVTMTTVGYGDFYPITSWGRVAAVALMTVGVGIFGVLASFLANLFLPKSSKDQDDAVPASTADLASIQAQLEAIKARLDALQSMVGDGDLPPTADVGREPSELGAPGQSPFE